MLRLALLPALALTIGACSEAETPVASETAETASIEPAVNPPSPTREDDIRHFLAQEYGEYLPLRYAVAWTDLNSDGADEAIVHVVSPMMCGTGGCNTLILTQAGPMWRKVGEISVSRTPVTLLGTASNGWSDITVAVGGGGGQSGNAKLAFDGEAYPSNPTVAPAEMVDQTGTVLLAEDAEMTELTAGTASAD